MFLNYICEFNNNKIKLFSNPFICLNIFVINNKIKIVYDKNTFDLNYNEDIISIKLPEGIEEPTIYLNENKDILKFNLGNQYLFLEVIQLFFRKEKNLKMSLSIIYFVMPILMYESILNWVMSFIFYRITSIVMTKSNKISCKFIMSIILLTVFIIIFRNSFIPIRSMFK